MLGRLVLPLLATLGLLCRYYGHEFQARLHWHVEDLGIRHAYLKPATPRLNGKVERSHRGGPAKSDHKLS